MSEENKELLNKEPADGIQEDLDAISQAPSESSLPKEKKPVTVSLASFLFSAFALILATVMVTYTCCSVYFKGKIAEAKTDMVVAGGDDYYELDVLRYLFEQHSFEELDDRKIMTQVMKAYVEATGDRYAEYFTREEYTTLMQSYAGDSVGIGITVTQTEILINGVEQTAIEVMRVNPRSPAYRAGVQKGDYIVAVGIGETAESVSSLKYDVAYTRLLGEAGTNAEFVVFRSEGAGYRSIPFSITREKIKTESVVFGKYEQDQTVGIVRILSFDMTTPSQFCEAIDTLQANGCTRFLFDVRDNPGGLLSSIRTVLSYFLNEGDTILSVKNNQNNQETITVKEISENDEDYSGLSVTAEDIGRYKNLNVVVVCNENTASAGELFVATFRDYGLATVVGTTTYGKGSVQGYIPLEAYGVSGVLKMTQQHYFPPCGKGYDGEGIEPNVQVELSAEEKKKFNIYEFESDNQLQEAVKHFSK